MKTSTIQNKKIMAMAFPALLFFGLICHLPAHALSTSKDSTSPQDVRNIVASTVLPQQNQENIFVYRIEGRPDPFVPFITKKAATSNLNEIVPIAEQLSGMQLFEPGQLNLVAILMVENNEYAMAEDFTGRGYILHTGMKIGKRGIIKSIVSNQVIIEETVFTRAGEKLTSNIVMLLKKEGEE
jgi:type IV pilus assembly protein PilP